MTAVLTPSIWLYDRWARERLIICINRSTRLSVDPYGEQYVPVMHFTNTDGLRFSNYEVLPEFMSDPRCHSVIENVIRRIY